LTRVVLNAYGSYRSEVQQSFSTPLLTSLVPGFANRRIISIEEILNFKKYSYIAILQLIGVPEISEMSNYEAGKLANSDVLWPQSSDTHPEKRTRLSELSGKGYRIEYS